MSRSRRRGKKQRPSARGRRQARPRKSRWLVTGSALVAVALLGSGAWWIHRMTADAVTIPEFSPKAKAGARLFAENCASCHGTNATGTEQGPPLLHKVYEPGHHPDANFQRAVKQGVISHHWRFGNMPPVHSVSRKDVAKIIAYVRELQRASGIP